MPLTKEQFDSARKSGFTTDQIIEFEKKRSGSYVQQPAQNQTNRVASFLPRENEVNEMISKRPDSLETLQKEIQTPFDFKNKPLQSSLKPIVTGLKVANVPFQRGVSAVAGMGLGLQKGNFGEGLKNMKKGFLGQKNQQLGDLVRTTGFGKKFNEPLSATTGFIAEMVTPAKLVNNGMKMLGKVTKWSDKGMMQAGQNLIKGADDAVMTIGKKLDEVYSSINQVKVKPDTILDDFSKLPEPVIKHIEEQVGMNFDEMLSDFDIARARQLKGVLGKLKPSAWGKGDKGAVELVTDEQMNKAYGSVKQAMQEGLINSGFKKNAESLLNADDAFSETMNASRFIKKTITEPVLRKPTRAGRAASRLQGEEDIAMRESLNVIKSAGGHARKNITKAVSQMEHFNRVRGASRAAGILGRSVVYGGVSGGITGKILE